MFGHKVYNLYVTTVYVGTEFLEGQNTLLVSLPGYLIALSCVSYPRVYPAHTPLRVLLHRKFGPNLSPQSLRFSTPSFLVRVVSVDVNTSGPPVYCTVHTL